MKFLLNILILFFTCLLQASPLVASSNNAISTLTPTFLTQSTQKLESEKKKAVLHFAKSAIEENILQQTPSHLSTTKQSTSFLKDAFQNFGGLQLEKSLVKSWVAFQDFSIKEKLSLVEHRAREVLEEVVNGAGNLLTAEGKFIDNLLEVDYLAYVTRKTNAGKIARPRLEWKEVRDYWLLDSPLARGNAFNKKAVDNEWYPYNEVHLGNGKRLDSYKPPANGNAGEIISRKATDLEDIQMSTFEGYLNEMISKYSPGTSINSPKYSPLLDNQTLQGQMYLEIPLSNQGLSNIQDYINLANSKGITLRFKGE